MYLDDFYERFVLDESLAERAGFNPYYREIQSGLGDPILIDGREFINLASNNYLGLADDTRVKEAAIKAVEKYGASLCGTPIATGYVNLLKKMEDRLSKFTGLEASVILPSCYQANNGLLLALAGKEDVIIVDHYAHSSLIQGIKAVGCKIRPFLHNDVEHLSKILEQSTGYRQVFIVTESVFSTDGTIAPLKDIVELSIKYNAVPVVDDSHGIGVIGKMGRGILEQQGIKDFQGIYTASLGKALANTGGVISGEKGVIDYLRYYCPHLVYSTALAPSVLGGIEMVLDIIDSDFEEISRRMWFYKDVIHNSLIEAGFETASGGAPINSILAGSPENTILLAKKLFENNILSTPFIPPSVPINEGKVRLIAGANLKEETIERAADIIKKAGKA